MPTRYVVLPGQTEATAINLLSDPGHIPGQVIIPNAVRFMPVWQLTNGKQGRNVLTMQVPAGFQATAAIASQMKTQLHNGTPWSGLAAFMPTTGGLLRVDLLDIRPPGGAIVVSSDSTLVPGTSASPAIPDESAAVLTIRTAVRGPAGRGRLYIPNFATNALQTGGVIADATVAALTQFTVNILTAITGAGGTWVLANPARAAYTGSTGTQHPARVAGLVPVVAVVVRDNHWDSQRRRGLR